MGNKLEFDLCREEQKVLDVILSKKYSGLKREETYNYKPTAKINLADYPKAISLYCGFGDLILWYEDLVIKAKVLKEKASLVDKSNF